MKKLIYVIVAAAVVFGSLVFTKNMIAKAALSAGIKSVTGLQISMKHIDVGLIKSVVMIRGLTILNPKGYEDRVMAELPEFYVDYDLKSFLQGKVHLRELRISIKELDLIRRNAKDVNINALKTLMPKQEAGKKPPEVKVDVLVLSIGKVVYKDYPLSMAREFNLDIHERLSNITDPQAIVNLILVRALKQTDLGALLNIDTQQLQRDLRDSIKSVQEIKDLSSETIKKTAEDLKSIFGISDQEK